MLLSATAALTLASCGSSTRGNSDSDTTAVAEPDFDSFTSPDLTLWQLHGRVRDCVASTFDAGSDASARIACDSLTFDPQGQIVGQLSTVTIHGQPFTTTDLQLAYTDDGKFVSGTDACANPPLSITLRRDNEGYLTYIEATPHDEAQADDSYTQNYTWEGGDMRGSYLRGPEASINTRYRYDAAGLPSTRVTITESLEGKTELTERYEYTRFDEANNWTERKISASQTTSYYEDGNDSGKPVETDRIERRVITYYR